MRCGCSSLASPPLPRAAADCGGIPAPSLRALLRRCGTRGAGAEWQGWRDCGDAGLPWKAGTEEMGRLVTWYRPRHNPIGGSRSQAAWVSMHRAAPSLRSSARGCAGPWRRTAGCGFCLLCRVERSLLPGCSPSSSLQLGRSDDCLRESIPLLLSHLPTSLPLLLPCYLETSFVWTG